MFNKIGKGLLTIVYVQLWMAIEVPSSISRHQLRRGINMERIPLLDKIMEAANIPRNIYIYTSIINKSLKKYTNSMEETLDNVQANIYY